MAIWAGETIVISGFRRHSSSAHRASVKPCSTADACRRGALVEPDSDIEPIRLQKQLFVHKGKPMAGPLRAFVELAGEML